ncbi:MAG: hypothetical protein J6X32_05615 [Salinivirgaceae bacterium]|nr:hypothetical protein [Salinivirgaceae bacterium]
MCTSIVVNKRKTIVGWNLDIMDFEYRIRPTDDGVYIEINDATEGWMPLFGANRRGDFVGMPTCWPHNERSNPTGGDTNIIMLNIDLLLMKKTLPQVLDFVQTNRVCSVPGLTFMSSLSDSNGNVLHIVPGRGFKYYEKPDYKIMTNFPPFVPTPLQHPWMGLDRYQKAESLLAAATNDFDVDDCFSVLKEVSQTVCPTVISMVYDVTENTVYWCYDRNYSQIETKMF